MNCKKGSFMYNYVKRLALVLACAMLLTSILAACNIMPGPGTESTSDNRAESETESNSESSETGEKVEDSDESENSAESSESASESKSESSVTESSESSESSSATEESTTAKVEETTEDTRFEKEYAPVYYMNAQEIAKATKDYEWGANQSNMLGGFLAKDKSYVTLIPFDGEQESCFYLFKTQKNVGPILVIKYRTVHKGFYMEVFTNSYDLTAQKGSNVNIRGLKTDGEWDIKIVDLNEKLPDVFNGKSLMHMRFDFANGDPIPPECEIDIAYVAFFNTVEDAQKFEYGEDYVAPDEGDDNVGDEKADLFFDALDIDAASSDYEAKNLDSATLADDLSYVTLKPKKGLKGDAYINLLTKKKNAAPYFAIKYRTDDLGYWIEVFMDSVNAKATGGSSFTFYPIDDGEWHIFVFNVQEHLGEEKFNGETVNYIRFDFMNINDDQTFGDWALDIEYIGFYDNALDALGKDYDPDAPANVFDAEDIKTAVDNKNTGIQSATLSENGDFVTIEAKEGETNAYAYIFTSKREAGRYLVVKYRTNYTGFYMQLWMNSGSYTAGAAKITLESFDRDGSWQYGVYDLYEALPEGQYNDQFLSHFRFDFMHRNGDKPAPAGVTLDVAYVAFFDSMEALKAYAGIVDEPEDNTPADSFFDATEIFNAAENNANKNVDSAILSSDEKYVTLTPSADGKDDAYISVLTKLGEAGDYLAIKYRTDDLGFWIEVFTDSVNKSATGGSSFTFYPIDDGEWHIFVINIKEKLGEEKFNGETVNYIRLDFMNINGDQSFGDWALDIEYIGFYDTELEAKGEDYDPNAPVNIFDAEEIKGAVDANGTRVESAVLSNDGSYVTVTAQTGKVDAYSYIFTSKRETGRYMVVKYRTTSAGFYMLLWMNSKAYTAGGNKKAIENIPADGKWQYTVIDLATTFGDAYNGQYLSHFRFDFIHMGGDKPAPAGTKLDVGYIAFFDSMEALDAYVENDKAIEAEKAEKLEEANFSAEEIAEAAKGANNKNVASALLSENKQFVTITAKQGGSADAYILLSTTPMKANKCVAIKYRTSDSGYWTEFFMDSVNTQATGGSNFTFYLEADGEWHILVIDVLEKLGESKFDGETVNYIRFDFVNRNSNETISNWSMDIAAIGFYASEEEAVEALSGEITDAKPQKPASNDPVFIMDAEYIKSKVDAKASGVESCTLSSDGSYVTVNPADNVKEATSYMFDTDVTVGRYMVVKYRTESAGFYMQLYMSSTAHTAGSGNINIEGIAASSEWQCGIFDLSEKIKNFDGEKLGHFRFDFCNTSASFTENTSLDVAYVAFFDSIEAAQAYAAK